MMEKEWKTQTGALGSKDNDGKRMEKTTGALGSKDNDGHTYIFIYIYWKKTTGALGSRDNDDGT